MEVWSPESMGYSSSLGILCSSQEFGVFLGKRKCAVFQVRAPAETVIPESGSGS